ncbi:MAG: DUF5020 domain-containing protein [Gammaproteobacteria bacterium]|nr:DUF5020 domain-containing protein [Gammaproteobacteria bacterium]
MRKKTLWLLPCMLMLANAAHAASWSSTNVQVLSGDSYELGPAKRTILTIENAAGWEYGDSFFFVDITNPWGHKTGQYVEFSPRASLNKIFDAPVSDGLIKEYFIASTLEMGNNLNAQLLGPGVALNLPGFRFANLNFYARKSHRDWATTDTDIGGQITATWQLPIAIASTQWLFEGFLDYAWGENNNSHPKRDNIMTAPRLLLDAGALRDHPGKIFIGIEQQIWRNKFGVADTDENVTQAMFKWVL